MVLVRGKSVCSVTRVKVFLMFRQVVWPWFSILVLHRPVILTTPRIRLPQQGWRVVPRTWVVVPLSIIVLCVVLKTGRLRVRPHRVMSSIVVTCCLNRVVSRVLIVLTLVWVRLSALTSLYFPGKTLAPIVTTFSKHITIWTRK